MAKNRRGKQINPSAHTSEGYVEKRERLWKARSKAKPIPVIFSKTEPRRVFRQYPIRFVKKRVWN